MKAKFRFIIAACVLGLLMTGPFALTAALLFADAKDAERAAFAENTVHYEFNLTRLSMQIKGLLAAIQG